MVCTAAVAVLADAHVSLVTRAASVSEMAA